MESTAKAMTDADNLQPSLLRCPFCNSPGVEVSDVHESRLSAAGPAPGVDGALPFTGTIYEFQVHCPRCQRKYRQACPDSLLPLDFTASA